MWILNDASDIFHVTDDLHSGNKKLFLTAPTFVSLNELQHYLK